MSYRLILIVIMCLVKDCILSSQTILKFNPTYGQCALSVDSTYYLTQNDSIQITSLRFYISNIELFYKTTSVWQDSSPFHLVDAVNEKSLWFTIPNNISYTKLKFNLGIDSLTNVSGAMGGDLDPTNGMYWTWQSGYINFKLEGNSNLCKTRHNEFQFHLGGYQYPFNSLQTVFIEITSKPLIEINLDVKHIIHQIDFEKQHHIMSPSKESIDFLEIIINSFSIKK